MLKIHNSNLDFLADKQRLEREEILSRPSYMLRPELSRFGDRWLAEYGGAIAWGDSPAAAFSEFDKLWQKGN